MCAVQGEEEGEASLPDGGASPAAQLKRQGTGAKGLQRAGRQRVAALASLARLEEGPSPEPKHTSPTS